MQFTQRLSVSLPSTAAGAGPYSVTVPSRRSTQIKMAPAASSPRRATTAGTPAAWQRRKYALTQISLLTRMPQIIGLCSRRCCRLGEVASRDALQLAHQFGSDAPGLAHLAVVLKRSDGVGSRGAHGPVDRPRCVAEIGENLLHRLHRGVGSIGLGFGRRRSVPLRRDRAGGGGRRLSAVAEQDMAQQIVGSLPGNGKPLVPLIGRDRGPRLVLELAVGGADIIAASGKLTLDGLDEKLRRPILGGGRRRRKIGTDRGKLCRLDRCGRSGRPGGDRSRWRCAGDDLQWLRR